MKTAVVFGGEGFVGKKVVNFLKKDGFKVKIAGSTKKHPDFIKADITILSDVKKAISKKCVVINLVGLTPLKKPKKTTYKKVHVDGVKNIIDVCKEKQCRLIHMSALGANKNAATEYLRTKGEGEELIINSGLDVTVFCPSIIYDKDSEIVKMFDSFLSMGIFPSISTKNQPVFREDIAKMFVFAANGKIKEKKLEIGGPQKLSLLEMAKIYADCRRKKLVSIPKFIFLPGLFIMALFGINGYCFDNIRAIGLNNTTKKQQNYLKLKSYSQWIKEVY